MLGGLGALIADLYPTRARATAHSVLFNVGRAIGGFAPIGIASLATAHGFGFALAALAAIYGVQFVTMFALPERRGDDPAVQLATGRNEAPSNAQSDGSTSNA